MNQVLGSQRHAGQVERVGEERHASAGSEFSICAAVQTTHVRRPLAFCIFQELLHGLTVTERLQRTWNTIAFRKQLCLHCRLFTLRASDSNAFHGIQMSFRADGNIEACDGLDAVTAFGADRRGLWPYTASLSTRTPSTRRLMNRG